MHSHDAGSGDDSDVAGVPGRLQLARSELEEAIAAVVSTRSSREEIRLALRPMCSRAREEKMDAAELVKVVKQSFAQSAGRTALRGATERQQMLDKIISVCIDEYYAAG